MVLPLHISTHSAVAAWTSTSSRRELCLYSMLESKVLCIYILDISEQSGVHILDATTLIECYFETESQFADTKPFTML